MRQGQQNKRMRGRSRKGPNPLARTYESNGPDVKIRGTALHIAEKYLQLARDAQSSGDRVAGENYLQHAEHYFRIVAAAQAQMPQAQPAMRNDSDDSDDDEDRTVAEPDRGSAPQPFVQPSFGLSDPQPYVNGAGRGDGEDGGNGAAEGRHDGREQREGREQGGGGYRGRRRRPYRDRSGGDQPDVGGGAEERSEAASGAASDD
jgi:Domain of unknown function (DUF4167)